MADYSGTVKFKDETGKMGLVYQYPYGSSVPDGYRLVHNASFSSQTLESTINYSYTTPSGDGEWITIE